MSTVAPVLHKFLVYAPDYTDEGALGRRLAVRENHLKTAKTFYDSKKLKIGGATFDNSSINETAKKMTGSVLVFEAESLEEVRKIVEEDVYYTGNVWDKEKLVITPVAFALGN